MRRTRRKAKRSKGVRTSISLEALDGFTCVLSVPFCGKSFNREVFGLRMVDNNSRSRLLWLQLKLLAQFDADARRIEEGEELLLIFESRAGRITEAVT